VKCLAVYFFNYHPIHTLAGFDLTTLMLSSGYDTTIPRRPARAVYYHQISNKPFDLFQFSQQKLG
jgi:hypothetical protein